MIFVPFILAFVFFLMYEKENPIKEYFTLIRQKYISKSKIFTELFNCIFCQSFWIGLVIVLICGASWYYIFYIPVVTVIIYKFLTT